MLQLRPLHSQRAIDRPVPLRMRADLEIAPRYGKGQLAYIIKDPVTSAHHRLWEEEFSLLQMLDGQASLADLKRKFEALFPAARLDVPRLQVLLGLFYRNGLVLSDRPGQAGTLWQRGLQWKAQQRQGFSHLLALRLPGVNPDRVLQILDRWCGWIFSPSALRVSALFMAVSWLFMFLHIQEAAQQLPSLEAYLTPANLIWMIVIACGLKILHELGHGLACTHYGGQCHEMGIMFLAFVPALYCDVSDAWMIQSRWQRAMIAAAGMWIEMLAATLCAWLWWASEPGLLQAICFNAMLIGTVSTLLINGNPLLRYDGYFLLADLLDLPNMWNLSRLKLMQQFDRFFYSRPTLVNADQPQPVPGSLGVYAVLSIAYQSLILCALMVVIYVTLRNAHAELMGIILVMVVGAGITGKPVRAGIKLFDTPEKRRHMRWSSVIALGSVCGLCLVLLFWPLPYSFRAPALFQMSAYTPITIVEPGTLIDALPEGTRVTKDQVIARIASPSLELELLSRSGELNRQQAKLSALQSKRADDPLVASQITAAQEAVRGLDAEVERLRAAKEKLTIRAPLDGIIVAPLQRPLDDRDWDAPDSSHWSGTPLDPTNAGCMLETGETLCAIASPNAWQAMVFVTQDQAELLQDHSQATVKSAVAVDARWNGVVNNVSSQSLTQLPQEIVKSGLIPLAGKSSADASIEPMYIATLDVTCDDPRLGDWAIVPPLHNSRGVARLQVAPQSLAYRLWRLIDATFTLEITTE